MKTTDVKRLNLALCVICGVLLTAVYVIYTDAYKRFDTRQNKTVTVGIFSDSYWEVQNGYSYRILENAIAIFEKEHPSVHVEYTSGILKEDYPEWLSEQLLSDRKSVV